MIISRYFVFFIVFSVVGWLIECTFCTIRDHHWHNRGFLYGPLCPIYGTGAVMAMAIFSLLPSAGIGGDYPLWQIFLICAAGSAVLEYVTSWILEKCFHAIWWDYSRVPLNIQGRVCLPMTCLFGLGGTAVVKWVIPFAESLPTNNAPLLNEALSIVLAVILGMDLALTVESLTRLTQRMEEAEERFNERMETRVQTVRQGPAAVGCAVSASAKDAGETAAIAAMLAADAARDRLDDAKERADAARERAEETGRHPRPERAEEAGRHPRPERAEEAGRRPRPEREKPFADDPEMQERLRSLTENLSGLDRYHIRSIEAWRPKKRTGGPDVSEKLRSFFDELQKRAGKPEDRQVKKK